GPLNALYVHLRDQKKKALFDGELARLAQLAKGVIEKNDRDTADEELTAALDVIHKTYLQNEPTHKAQVEKLRDAVKERRELYRCNGLLAQLAELSGDAKAEGRIAVIGKAPYREWVPKRREKVERLRNEAIGSAHKYRYTEECNKLDALPGPS